MSKTSVISRRDFLSTTAQGVAAAAVGTSLLRCGGGGNPAEANPPPIPNIILITADDLGWKDLHCYGNQQIDTPNLDRLAGEGVRFENAFVTSSSCSPSRASLLTGQYPHTNGVDGLTTSHPEKTLIQGYPTLPSRLHDAEYITALEGKWHIAGPFDPVGPYGYDEQLRPIIPMIPDSSLTCEYIEAHRDQRFYLEINYLNNHRHFLSGEFEFDPDFPVDPETITVPEYWHLPDWPEIRLEVAKYYSQTMKMDRMIGEVLDTLDDFGLAENTLVLFLSDNGPPFPGNKMTLYDRGMGTPLLVRWPAAAGPGMLISDLVSSVDIMPTLLEAAGLPLPGDLQGKSFLPLLRDTGSGVFRDAVFAEMTYHVGYLPTRAVRTRQWKYIRNYSDNPVGLDQCEEMEWAQKVAQQSDQPWTRPRIPEELYLLEEDPQEQNNLIDDPVHQEDLEAMKALLDKHMADTADPYLGAPFTNDYEGSG